jgi:lysophospholipase L1-like esterase
MRASRLAGAVVLALAITVVAALHASASTTASLVAVRVAAPLAGPPSSIAALGDSFNTGFDAGTHRGDAPSLSWSTGDNPSVDSLYLRLLDENPAIEGHRYLIARDGSKIGDLARQMAIAADHRAQLITVQSGGNDICSAKDPDHATPPAQFQDEFTQALDVMRRRLPNARLLLTSITDEGRWNDGSATVPGNGKQLSDGTVCDPKLDSKGRQDPSRQRDPALRLRHRSALPLRSRRVLPSRVHRIRRFGPRRLPSLDQRSQPLLGHGLEGRLRVRRSSAANRLGQHGERRRGSERDALGARSRGHLGHRVPHGQGSVHGLYDGVPAATGRDRRLPLGRPRRQRVGDVVDHGAGGGITPLGVPDTGRPSPPAPPERDVRT